MIKEHLFAPYVRILGKGRNGARSLLAVKGEGGEFERVPDRGVLLYGTTGSGNWSGDWSALSPRGRFLRHDNLDLKHFAAVWRGEADDAYGTAAVIGTLALVIRALALETSSEQAHALATEWWDERHGQLVQRSCADVS
jgi:hypothetical protein